MTAFFSLSFVSPCPWSAPCLDSFSQSQTSVVCLVYASGGFLIGKKKESDKVLSPGTALSEGLSWQQALSKQSQDERLHTREHLTISLEPLNVLSYNFSTASHLRLSHFNLTIKQLWEWLQLKKNNETDGQVKMWRRRSVEFWCVMTMCRTQRTWKVENTE